MNPKSLETPAVRTRGRPFQAGALGTAGFIVVLAVALIAVIAVAPGRSSRASAAERQEALLMYIPGIAPERLSAGTLCGSRGLEQLLLPAEVGAADGGRKAGVWSFSYDGDGCYDASATRQDLNVSAQRLQDQMNVLYQKGYRRFVLLAHSLGGAVVAEWGATQYEIDLRSFVAAAITVDSPVFPSRVCDLRLGFNALVGGGGKAGEQLQSANSAPSASLAPLPFLWLGNSPDFVVPADCSNPQLSLPFLPDPARRDAVCPPAGGGTNAAFAIAMDGYSCVFFDLGLANPTGVLDRLSGHFALLYDAEVRVLVQRFIAYRLQQAPPPASTPMPTAAPRQTRSLGTKSPSVVAVIATETPRFCVSGYVTGPEGPSKPLPGISVSSNNGKLAVSGTDGGYSICGLGAGAYRLTPSLVAYTFGPAFKDVTVGPSATQVNFTAFPPPVTYCISGFVTGSAGPSAPVAGVTVSASNGTSTNTAANGSYQLCRLPGGSARVTPTASDYVFGPVSKDVTLGPDAVQVNFTAFVVKRFCIGGYTTGSQGPFNPMAGVTVEISGPDSARMVSAADGSFKACGLREGNYSLTGSRSELVCNPNPRSVFLSGGDALAEGFTCTSIVGPRCQSPTSPLFPTDGAYIPAGQSVVLQWIGIQGCRYGVTLLEGCSNVHVPVLNVPNWTLTGLPAGSRCGWFVQGVDSNGAYDSPVAQWWVNWGDPPQPRRINFLGCTPTAVQTGATVSCSPSVSGTVADWVWRVDGVQQGAGPALTTSWTNPGSKTIQLIVSNVVGNDTKSIAIQVAAPPQPSPSTSLLPTTPPPPVATTPPPPPVTTAPRPPSVVPTPTATVAQPASPSGAATAAPTIPVNESFAVPYFYTESQTWVPSGFEFSIDTAAPKWGGRVVSLSFRIHSTCGQPGSARIVEVTTGEVIAEFGWGARIRGTPARVLPEQDFIVTDSKSTGTSVGARTFTWLKAR